MNNEEQSDDYSGLYIFKENVPDNFMQRYIVINPDETSQLLGLEVSIDTRQHRQLMSIGAIPRYLKHDEMPNDLKTLHIATFGEYAGHFDIPSAGKSCGFLNQHVESHSRSLVGDLPSFSALRSN